MKSIPKNNSKNPNPCPFCNSSVVHIGEVWGSNISGHNMFYCVCAACHASGSWKGTKSAAVRAWNHVCPIEVK